MSGVPGSRLQFFRYRSPQCQRAFLSRNMDLAKLAVGDAVSINYSFVFNRDGKEVTPLLENAVGGNMMILKDGQITEQNYWDSYNTMVYSRSAYGTSRDNKTLYMVVIDKSGCEWGVSDGCTTEQMLQIVKPLGVWNMINVDAGGSAQLMVTDQRRHHIKRDHNDRHRYRIQICRLDTDSRKICREYEKADHQKQHSEDRRIEPFEIADEASGTFGSVQSFIGQEQKHKNQHKKSH